MKKVNELTPAPEQICCLGKELYLYCPNGVAGSKLFRMDFERLLAVQATSRNWNTVNRLCELSLKCR